MRYGLGFDERTNNSVICDNSHGQLLKLNLFPFVADYSGDQISILSSNLIKLQEGLLPEDEVVTSFQPLYSDIRESLLRGVHLDYSDYDKINALTTKFVLHFRGDGFNKLTYYPQKCTLGPAEIGFEWGSDLYGRYGNVELRVIENYLRDPHALERELGEISRHLDDESYMYRPATRPHWLSSADVNFNLRMLMTNAGFYIPGSDISIDMETLDSWAKDYLRGLAESKALFPYPGSYPNFFVTQDFLFKKQGCLKDYVDFPGAGRFYDLLEGQTVLLMTPFYCEVNDIFQSRKLFQLYTDITIPEFRIHAIPAYISTYPNRPHASWSETFSRMKDEIDDAFRREKFSLFFASCGCYGMPICNYVHERYGIASVYYGNFVNTLFGIRQACSEGFMPGRRRLENWAASRLGEFQNMDKIDAGRYV